VTTQWREIINCPNCGCQASTEQPWKHWIRSNPELDSRQHCMCFGDCDLWCQRYGIRHMRGIDREVMYLMQIEVKTNNAILTSASKDMHRIVDALLRTNTWKDQRDNGKFLTGHDQNTRIVASYIAGRKVRVLCYGVHLLRMSGNTPATSETITWDGRKITAADIVPILRYELHPDSLLAMEHRAHKRRFVDQPALFELAEFARRP